MSTRGAIARVNGDSFKGVYHHFDAYPEGLGATLFALYRGQFKRDLPRMLKTLIDEHPAGWSTINGSDWSLEPGFDDYMSRSKNFEKQQPERPQCYCHGTRSEEAWEVDEKNAAGSGVEYAYAFSEQRRHMFVLASYNHDGSKAIGMFGFGNPEAKWRVIADVDLDAEEPDWARLGEEARA